MHPQAIYLSKDVAGRLVLLQRYLCSAAANGLYNAGDNVISPYAAPQLCRLSLELLSLPWATELPLRELRWDPGNVSIELDFPRATNSAYPELFQAFICCCQQHKPFHTELVYITL